MSAQGTSTVGKYYRDSAIAMMLRQKGCSEESISRLYHVGVLKAGRPFKGCSIWGIDISSSYIQISNTIIAIHESGHAVAAIEMGGSFDHAEVNASLLTNRRTGGLSGAVFPDDYPFRHLVTAAAGPIAQSKAMFGDHTRWNLGSIGDLSMLWTYEQVADIPSIIGRAKSIVDDKWDTIKLLAAELTVETMLSYDRCLEIISP